MAEAKRRKIAHDAPSKRKEPESESSASEDESATIDVAPEQPEDTTPKTFKDLVRK